MHDSFAIFGSKLDCDHFQERWNLLHQALKFRVEKEPNNSLNFLDVVVEKEGIGFLPALTGNQHLQGNISVRSPLAKR